MSISDSVNNNAIHILRGEREAILDNVGNIVLSQGQPLYNIDDNYLTVGGQENTPLNSQPIVCRQIVGYIHEDSDSPITRPGDEEEKYNIKYCREKGILFNNPSYDDGDMVYDSPTINGRQSFGWGHGGQINGVGSTSFGGDNNIFGSYSATIGQNNTIGTSDTNSRANAIAMGKNISISNKGSTGLLVAGQYNAPQTTYDVFVVGNGSSTSSTHNAISVSTNNGITFNDTINIAFDKNVRGEFKLNDGAGYSDNIVTIGGKVEIGNSNQLLLGLQQYSNGDSPILKLDQFNSGFSTFNGTNTVTGNSCMRAKGIVLSDSNQTYAAAIWVNTISGEMKFSSKNDSTYATRTVIDTGSGTTDSQTISGTLQATQLKTSNVTMSSSDITTTTGTIKAKYLEATTKTTTPSIVSTSSAGLTLQGNSERASILLKDRSATIQSQSSDGTKTSKIVVKEGTTIDISGTTNMDDVIIGTTTATNKTLKLGSLSGTTLTPKVTLSTNGTIVATTSISSPEFYATSDRRLKTNIQQYTCEKSILDLPVYSFDYIESGKHTIGCMAQELQQICPTIVSTREDGYLTISESKIVYLLLEEVKKLKNRVDELSTSI